ncbi:MAG: DUF4276 family protein [Gammaproteobacteria bacterium]
MLPVVEGAGDEKAVPELIRRVLQANNNYETRVLKPQRRGELPRVRASFENWFRVALKEQAAILWVMDFDCTSCDCAKDCAGDLYERANHIQPHWPFRVAFMVQEFETLFLAEKNATCAALSLSQDLEFPADPERVRDAKGWLSRKLPSGQAYKPTVHQAKISAQLDLSRLRAASPSFRHFEKAILQLCDTTV